MPLVFDNEKLKGELNTYFRDRGRALSDVRLTERVLAEACPIIEKRLGDPTYLRQWTHRGKQAFYNDEPGGIGETMGIFSSGLRAGDHMVNQFHVAPVLSAGGYGGFEITNDKNIYSKKYGKMNLFDLLWKGFGAYTAPSYKKFERLDYRYVMWLSQQSKSSRLRKKWKTGITMYTEPPMTFYYRYASKWFYKLKSRKGMDTGLKDKFHMYVMGAIEYGLDIAIKNIVESGEGDYAMNKFLGDIG
jgi:hypothetical protein